MGIAGYPATELTAMTDESINAGSKMAKAWWKSAVVYQIYPSSFCDSDGDGWGDLKGITSKLDYLKELGVDVVWLSPIFKSPQVDMGYDISDYKDVHGPYGSVEGVEELAKQLHDRSMKLMLDLVVNHTSDEHDWFIESRSSKQSPKRDWYFWRPGKVDENGQRRPPNNWKTALGGGSVWKYDEGTAEYYLHLYDTKQPDLNFECVEVREAVYDLMRFWVEKGCDGYRMDVIGRISKNLDFADAPVTDPSTPWQEAPRQEGPRLHEFIQEMNQEVMSKYDLMTVGELNHTSPEQMMNYVHPDRHELQMGFTFEHVNLGRGGVDMAMVEPHKLSEFKKVIARWQDLREKGGWHALYLENHDQPRSISIYGNDSPEYRTKSGRLLALMHTTLWGTVYLHQGQEIGMINLPKDWPLEEWKDCKTQNVAKKIIDKGEDVDRLLKKVYHKARDNGRSPMQWNSSDHAGFTTAKPWMRIPDDYKTWNVANQVNDPNSVLGFWKEVLALRKQYEDDLVYGSFEILSPEDEQVFAYVRAESILILLNVSADPVNYRLPVDVTLSSCELMLSTGSRPMELANRLIKLEAFEGAMFRIKR